MLLDGLFIGLEGGEFFPERIHQSDHRVGYFFLERRVLECPCGVVGHECVMCVGMATGAQQFEEILDTGAHFSSGRVAGIRDSRFDLFAYAILFAKEIDIVFLSQALAHFPVWIGWRENFGRFSEEWLRVNKVFFAKLVIETLGDVARQFEMLLLVLSYRHVVSVVNQDIGSLKYRIGEQPQTNEGVFVGFAELVSFVLELRHAGKLAIAGGTAQNPGEFHVFGHETLHKYIFRFNTACEQIEYHFPGVLAELDSIVRHGHGVVVHHAIGAIILILKSYPVLYGTEVISKV